MNGEPREPEVDQPPPLFDLTKIGFDLDGTLDRPEIAALARVLFAAGVEIHIITAGYVGETEETAAEMVARKEARLEFLGVPYSKLHIVTGQSFEEAGQEKAAIINYYELPIMFDDAPTFVKEMVEGTSAMILHLKPGGNTDEE